MIANFHGDNVVAGIQTCAEDSTSLQSTDGAEVMLVRSLKNTLYVEDSVATVRLNHNGYSEMRTTAP